MRLVAAMISVLLVCSYSASFAQSPPFQKVTIKGKTKDIYNKVCLFEKGSSKEPFKTEFIFGSGGAYRIDVDIPDDMKEKDDYLYTDMRFWGDENNNGIRDPGEPISPCHFIMWIPSKNIVYLKVYKGQKYLFKAATMNYNYK